MNQVELSIWPAPRATESARAYMLRAAEKNRIPLMFREALQSLDGATWFISQAHVKNATLAAHLLERFWPEETSKRSAMRMVRLGSDTVSDKVLMTTDRQVCPACLAGGSHDRLEWELRSVQACPVHGITLIRVCPRCENPIQWHRSGLLSCVCGQDLRAVDSEEAMAWQVTWAKLVKRAVNVSLAPTIQPSKKFRFVPYKRFGLNPSKRFGLRYIPIRLSKLLLMADVVRYALLPAQTGPDLVLQHEMLTPSILENRAYCAYLWNAIFLFAATDPFSLAKMLTPGQAPEWVFEAYKDLTHTLALSDVLSELTLTEGVVLPALNAVFFDVRRHGVPPHAYRTEGWDEDDWADEEDLNQELLQEAHA